jgi:hypothetical protein
MFPLIAVDKIFSRLGVGPDAGVSALMSSALEGAYLHLEAVLQTQFLYNDHADVFFVDRTIYSPVGGAFRLKLSNGFIDKDTVSVSLSEQLFDPAWGAQSGGYHVNPEKGFIDVPDTYLGKAVRVSYYAGLENAEDDPETVPKWLQEAALAQAVKLMNVQQFGDEKPELVKILKMLETHKTNILDRKLRVSSRAIPPVYSE